MALIAVIEKFRHTNLHIKLCLIVSIPDSVSQTLSFSLFSVLYLVQNRIPLQPQQWCYQRYVSVDYMYYIGRGETKRTDYIYFDLHALNTLARGELRDWARDDNK